ncbi:MAG: restriction endonuclease [Methanobacteriaceae archaeon]
MNSSHLLPPLSLVGLLFLILMYLWAPTSAGNGSLILFLFVLICILGMLAASYPRYCLFNNTKPGSSTSHHPDCEHFQSHTFTIRNKKYCSGCSGLFLGALVGIIICLFYYLYGFSSPLLFWIGVITVGTALFQLNYLKVDRAGVKFLSNLVLVVGSASILLGILEFKVNLGPYFMVLVVLWVYTRTSISVTDHDRICDECPDTSCCYNQT